MSHITLNNYLPIQPAIKDYGQGISYREILPIPPLNSVIFCYWQLKTDLPLTSLFTYQVVADGCIDIFFELSDSIIPYVMGFANSYTKFDLPNEFNYIGIRFLPSFFPQLFDVPAFELSDKYTPLSEIHQNISSFITNSISPAASLETIASGLNDYFSAYCAKINWANDTRFYNALNQIIARQGVINLKNDVDIGLSPRQLRRLFHHYIGDSPKTFSQVVRFQGILQAKPSRQSLAQNRIFYDAGYFDQAHFIKEFKKFYGLTPHQAFKK